MLEDKKGVTERTVRGGGEKGRNAGLELMEKMSEVVEEGSGKMKTRGDGGKQEEMMKEDWARKGWLAVKYEWKKEEERKEEEDEVVDQEKEKR